MPQFLSATVLPGLGMNVLQIAAYLPGRGEVNLMASPPLDEAAKTMNGSGSDTSLAMGGAFEAPWAGRIWGAPTNSGHMTTTWRGRTIALPMATGGSSADGGLMLAQASASEETVALPDGGDAQAVFTLSNPDAHWPSKVEVTVTVLLSSRSIELTATARNNGSSAEPVGIGWRPRFAILGGNRSQVRLRITGTMRVEAGGGSMPTGRLVPVAGTPNDFTVPGGARLGTASLDDCFAALHRDLLGNGPVAELVDPASGYGLRLTALSPTIKAMCVSAPASSDFVSIDPRFNYPDPFGREWGKDVDTGMVVLQPSQSTQWKVRLELFSPAFTPSPR
jgi:galactose mutarotase-like enzyme